MNVQQAAPPAVHATGRFRRRRTPGSGLITDVSAAAVCAFLSITFSLSYSSMLFAGTPPSVQAQGVAVMLVSSIVMAVAGAAFSTLPFTVITVDGSLIAIVAAIMARIVADMSTATPLSLGRTLVVTLALTTAATGLAFLLIGQSRGGRIVRFVPYQVMAGLLAASGWALAAGGARVAIGQAVTPGLLEDPASSLKLLAAVAFGTALVLAVPRIRHPAALPAMILAATALHHGTFRALGWTLGEQRGAGWLVAVPSDLTVSLPWTVATLSEVDWGVLGRQAPDLLALVPVAAIYLLLNLNGVEAATERDIDTDRDLKANGLAALLCGVAGGVSGITSISRSLLMFRMGVRGRRACMLAGLAGVLPLVWPELLGFLPRPILGGLLVFSGVGLLRQWIIYSKKRLSWPEWITVLVTLAIAVQFGLIAAAFAGLLLGCITFAVIYSRQSPIRARYDGEAARSRVERSATERAALGENASAVLVLHLQGFIFFGTASRIVDEVKRDPALLSGRLRFLILDFARVDAIDGSALANFERLQRAAASRRITLTFTSMPPKVASRLAELSNLPGAHRHVAQTLDAGLEWCEEQILAPLLRAPSLPSTELLRAEFAEPADAAAFLALLQVEDVAAGTVLMRQGEQSRDLLFLETGRLSVTVQFNGRAPMRVRSFRHGCMVGEIGFCLGLPRTATVTADEPCRILRFNRAAMQQLEGEHPAAALALQRAVMRRMGDQLLDKDHLISALILDAPVQQDT